MSTHVNAFTPVAQAFLGFGGERRVRTMTLAKPSEMDLKSASGKPECRFESGRGHHAPDDVHPQAIAISTKWSRNAQKPAQSNGSYHRTDDRDPVRRERCCARL